MAIFSPLIIGSVLALACKEKSFTPIAALLDVLAQYASGITQLAIGCIPIVGPLLRRAVY